MASNKSSNSKKIMVPQARAAMNKFKMEAANEVGVDLKKGYNGSMTTKEAAALLDCSVKSYDNRLQRVRRKLQRLIRKIAEDA